MRLRRTRADTPRFRRRLRSHAARRPPARPPAGPAAHRRPAALAARAAAAGLAPGRWLGPPLAGEADAAAAAAPRSYGAELTAEEWDPLGLAPGAALAASTGRGPPPPAGGAAGGNSLLGGALPGRVAGLIGLIALSRLGVYIRLPGVDVERFAEAMSGSGLLGYIDTLSGGSISKVGVFSLGIVPYINASIMLQLLATAFPSLKRLQREEGPQGRARFLQYQKLAALAFAVAQAAGQLTYIRPYVPEWSLEWLAGGVVELTAGAMILVHVADAISELKLGNGTSVLIFANIASALPTSVGAAFAQASARSDANVAVYAGAFFLTTLGIVYVQEAERQIPMAYASRYRAGALAGQVRARELLLLFWPIGRASCCVCTGRSGDRSANSNRTAVRPAETPQHHPLTKPPINHSPTPP